MNKWNKLKTDALKQRYAWPEGWDSQDKVAKDLDCSSAMVDRELKPAIEIGMIERKSFEVFDPVTNQVVRKVGYREIDTDTRQKPIEGKKADKGTRIQNTKTGKYGTVSDCGTLVLWESGAKTPYKPEKLKGDANGGPQWRMV